MVWSIKRTSTRMLEPVSKWNVDWITSSKVCAPRQVLIVSMSNKRKSQYCTRDWRRMWMNSLFLSSWHRMRETQNSKECLGWFRSWRQTAWRSARWWCRRWLCIKPQKAWAKSRPQRRRCFRQLNRPISQWVLAQRILALEMQSLLVVIQARQVEATHQLRLVVQDMATSPIRL